MASQRTISDIGAHCLEIFNACLSKDPGDGALGMLEGEQRRFRAWANRLKVFTRRHVNLDAQLHAAKYDQARQMVQILLDVLERNLLLGTAAPDPSRPCVLPIWSGGGSIVECADVGEL